jgi:MoxR-like ATPase
MFGIGKYIIGASLLVAAGAGAWGFKQDAKAARALADLDAAQAATRATQAELNNCAARILNIQEAQADEAHFDSIPDSDLGADIPAHWLLSPADPGDAADD